MMSTCCSKHVETWNKHIEKEYIKLVIIQNSESVFVALLIQHAMQLNHIVICDLSCSTVFFKIVINGTMSEKQGLLNIKCVFDFL